MTAEGSLRTPGSGETIAADLDENQQKVQKIGTQAYNGISGLWEKWTTASEDAQQPGSIPGVMPYLCNGVGTGTADRQCSNSIGIQLVNAGNYTTEQTSAYQTNPNARGVIVSLAVNTTGSGSLNVKLQTDQGFELCEWDAVTGNAILIAYPGAQTTSPLPSGGYAPFSIPLPRVWRAVVTPSGSTLWNYNLYAQLIV